MNSDDRHDYTSITPSFGLVLRILMHERGMRVSDMARHTGLSRGYISSLMNEKKTNPGAMAAHAIAQVLEVTIETLIVPGRMEIRIQRMGGDA